MTRPEDGRGFRPHLRRFEESVMFILSQVVLFLFCSFSWMSSTVLKGIRAPIRVEMFDGAPFEGQSSSL